MSLTAKQIKNYENNGYISPIDVLSKKEEHDNTEEIDLIQKNIIHFITYYRNFREKTEVVFFCRSFEFLIDIKIVI